MPLYQDKTAPNKYIIMNSYAEMKKLTTLHEKYTLIPNFSHIYKVLGFKFIIKTDTTMDNEATMFTSYTTINIAPINIGRLREVRENIIKLESEKLIPISISNVVERLRMVILTTEMKYPTLSKQEIDKIVLTKEELQDTSYLRGYHNPVIIIALLYNYFREKGIYMSYVTYSNFDAEYNDARTFDALEKIFRSRDVGINNTILNPLHKAEVYLFDKVFVLSDRYSPKDINDNYAIKGFYIVGYIHMGYDSILKRNKVIPVFFNGKVAHINYKRSTSNKMKHAVSGKLKLIPEYNTVENKLIIQKALMKLLYKEE